MADRFKFAEVRQEVIEMLKKDLLGPSSENEILNQNPRFEYIVGMLAPQTSENDSNEQEIDGDASFEGDADYTAGEDDDNEPVFTNRFKTPSSIGISFYLESSTKSFNVDVTWGDYTKASDKTTNKEGKEVDVSTYKRHPQKETVVIDLQEFSKNKEYPLVCDSNVILYVSKIGLKQGYTLITAYVNNKRKNPESDIAGMMFQVNLRAYSQDKMDIFVAEHISGGNESIRAIQKRYQSLSEKEAHEILAMVSATAQSNDDSAELVVTAPPSFALKTKPTKVTVREMLMGARKSILITGYSLSDYFAELVDCVIQKSQEGVLVKFFVNDIESQKAFDRLCCYKGKFLRIYNYPKQEDKMSALHAKVISVDQTDTLITSANLSYHGQEGNIELGARIHSKELAKQVEDIFTSLVFKRIFVEL